VPGGWLPQASPNGWNVSVETRWGAVLPSLHVQLPLLLWRPPRVHVQTTSPLPLLVPPPPLSSSAPLLFWFGPNWVHHGATAVGIESYAGTYGLMSRTGVPLT
jgi:hypothetical protein